MPYLLVLSMVLLCVCVFFSLFCHWSWPQLKAHIFLSYVEIQHTFRLWWNGRTNKNLFCFTVDIECKYQCDRNWLVLNALHLVSASLSLSPCLHLILITILVAIATSSMLWNDKFIYTCSQTSQFEFQVKVTCADGHIKIQYKEMSKLDPI